MEANTHVNNLVGSSSLMVDGWTLDVDCGTAFPPVGNPPCESSAGFNAFACIGSNFWFGLTHTIGNVASIKTTLNGCGRARLDYGNCQNQFGADSGMDSVHVMLNGNEISSAANNGQELSKTIEFDFTNGDILELNEDGPSAIRFNSMTILSCCAG